jgi:hypothetical protein
MTGLSVPAGLGTSLTWKLRLADIVNIGGNVKHAKKSRRKARRLLADSIRRER